MPRGTVDQGSPNRVADLPKRANRHQETDLDADHIDIWSNLRHTGRLQRDQSARKEAVQNRKYNDPRGRVDGM
ncbi:MAG: hypothetical protein L6R37_002828 [Teloschistes peruensis]|nr:MAG: hypothetical protein L6R37_002828 [Teloschistes peruensis]